MLAYLDAVSASLHRVVAVSDVESVTAWLKRWRAGETRALDQMLPLVYAELRGIAAAQMRRERGPSTLQPTALVHEAFLKLVDSSQVDLSCQQFAVDLRRYLDGRPVLARATPRREVALKFLRRNRLAASAAAAIVLALVVGTGLALVQARRANEQAQIARSERDRAERVSEFLTSMLAAADPATGGREVTVVSLLDAAARGFDRDQSNDP